MAATTITAIVDDLATLLTTSPFSFARAKEPFSFRNLPSQRLDQVCCLLPSGEQREDYLGDAEAVIDRVTVRLARKVRMDPVRVAAELTADISSLTVAVGRHQPADPDYSARVTDWTLPEVRADDEYAVAEIDVLVDYDSVL